MIPKIIHYIWFGNNAYSKKIEQCINSWHKMMPDYEFKLWNEETFDIENSCQFVKEAYEQKKYAFVSDYVRLYALYEYGGIYLDTDIELIKQIPEDVIDHNITFSLDDGGYIAGSFIAAKRKQNLFKNLMDIYHKLSFIKSNGTLNLEVNNTYIQNSLSNTDYGYKQINAYQKLRDDIILYPNDFFHCRSLSSGKLHLTHNTYAIHWHTITWASSKTRIIKFLRINILVPLLGIRLYTKLTSKIKNGKTTI